MPRLVSGSRLPVGSSASRIGGRLTKARAMATRCCSPPESWCGRRFSMPARPTSSSVSGTVWRMRAAAAAEDLQGIGDVLEDRLVGQQAEVLEDAADLAAQSRDLALGQAVEVATGDEDAPARGVLLLHDELHHRRLARAGRADDEGELAARDLEADVVEGRTGRPRVGLRDVLEEDHASGLDSYWASAGHQRDSGWAGSGTCTAYAQRARRRLRGYVPRAKPAENDRARAWRRRPRGVSTRAEVRPWRRLGPERYSLPQPWVHRRRGADRRRVAQPLAVGARGEAARLELAADGDPGVGAVGEAARVVLLPDVDGGEVHPRRAACVAAPADVLADREGGHAEVGDDLPVADLADAAARRREATPEARRERRTGAARQRACLAGGRGRRGGEGEGDDGGDGERGEGRDGAVEGETWAEPLGRGVICADPPCA